MKKLYIIFLFLASCYHVISQDNSANDLHQLRQLEGSNQKVIEFFGRTDVFFTTDTAYCIIIPPMKCSRCEGVINPFIYELKNADQEALVIAMAFYPKSGALNHYLLNRQFMADHIISSTDLSFLKNFHFSTDEIQVPYIVKINIETGDLIYSKSTLGLEMNKSFVHLIRSANKPLEKVKSEPAVAGNEQLSIPKININLPGTPVLKPFIEMILGEEEGYPISRILFPSFNEELSYFSFMDELSFKIYLYNIYESKLTFYEGIEPGEKEERLFIDTSVSDTLYRVLKKMNIINSMYFNCTFLGDSLIITSSLPNIFFEDTTGEKLAYYNRSTYLFRSTDNNFIGRYITPEYLPDTNFTFEHLNTQFTDEGMHIWLPVSKGWPISGTEMLSEVESEDNPFLKDFYRKDPVMAIYDNKGNFLQYFGKLPAVYRENKLGYSYSSPLIRSYSGTYWYVDKFIGKIHGIKELTQKRPSYTIDVFNAPDYQSAIDPDIEPLEYIKDYKKVFTQSIIDYRVYMDTAYVVMKHEDIYFYKKYDLQGNLISENILPNEYDYMFASHFVLSVNKYHRWLIGIYESAELTSLYLFK